MSATGTSPACGLYPRLPPDLREALRRADSIWDGPPPPARKLDLVYLLPHHAVTGGMKILVEHIRQLRARGHRVRAAIRLGKGERALPAWAGGAVDGQVVARPGQPLPPLVGKADAVVVGWFQLLEEWFGAGLPVLHLEQGHEILFGDVPQNPAGAELARQYDVAMALPIPVAAVSPFVAGRLAAFGRRAGIVPNGIDLAAYAPAWLEPGPAQPESGHPAARAPGRRVLLVGHPSLPFKDFTTALRAIAAAQQAVPDLTVTWVSQVPAQTSPLPFPLQNRVAVPQAELPAIYREHDLLLFTSRYEGFALPPLEAMASGVPVVATRCGGIETYARQGENALLCPVGDAAALGAACATVLTDASLSARLAAEGRRTAERFGWDRATGALEEALLRVAGVGAR